MLRSTDGAKRNPGKFNPLALQSRIALRSIRATKNKEITGVAEKDLHYYEPANGHGLKHDPFNAIIAPRPIGWISTRGANGNINVAPYSYFNAVASAPP